MLQLVQCAHHLNERMSRVPPSSYDVYEVLNIFFKCALIVLVQRGMIFRRGMIFILEAHDIK
jgi:hypothetical protein